MSLQIGEQWVATPEHDKLMAREADRDLVQEFLDWLYEQGFTLVADQAWDGTFARHIHHDQAKGDLIARFLGVDPDAFRAEKDALVRALQEKARHE